jgi:molybdopterin adenylyltransferase
MGQGHGKGGHHHPHDTSHAPDRAHRHEAHRHGEEPPHAPGAEPGVAMPHGKSPAAEHRSHAPTQVACFVLTCSDSRAQSDDVSGRALREGLQAAGHVLVGSAVVKDDAEAIRAAVTGALDAGARAVLVTGGTGITRRDQTVEAVRPLLEREIPGFGELFRMLSFQEIGSAAWLSRATAGTVRGALVFLLPGSPNAVRLALERLILPELGHAVRELSR